MIKSEICITKYRGKTFSWFEEMGTMQLLSISDEKTLIGKIYVGKVKHVVKNLNACFVEFDVNKIGFLSFADMFGCENLVEGMNVAVQVVKDASKNKEAVLTMKLSIPGRYVVALYDNPTVNISRKITGENRDFLRKSMENSGSYAVTIRTNAEKANNMSDVLEERDVLFSLLDDILHKSSTRTCYSCVYEGVPDYLRFVLGIKEGRYERIITDDEEIYKNMSSYNPVLYKDEYEFIKLHSLESKIDELLSSRVWLKSGGNIVIDYTEAMTVIDVNTAKNDSKKEREQIALKTNLEAANEIARQIRLRNISGIIIVDFINMKDEISIEKLVQYLKEELSKDVSRCDFVDFTKLGLAEIVRKKTTAPITELLANFYI